MLAIYKKELRSYYTSVIGYVFIALFLAIIGVYFFVQNLIYQVGNFETTISSITFLFALLVPLLTMRLMAEENRQKTDQLLYTSPLTATSIVSGKFLSVFTVFLTVIGVICFYPLILSQYGKVPMESAYASIFGFALLGAAYLSMGLYISSLTESQVVAAVVTYIVFIFTALMEGIAGVLPTDKKAAFVTFTVILIIICLIIYRMMHNLTIALGIGLLGEAGLTAIYILKPTLFDGLIIKVFEWLSIASRFSPFYYGILDISSIVYYLSITLLFLFLTVQVIKKKRWS